MLPVPLEMSTHHTLFTTIQRILSFTTPTRIHSDSASLQHSTEILSNYSLATMGTLSLPWRPAILGNPTLPDARINTPTGGFHMQCNRLESCCCLPVSIADTELYYIIPDDLSLANSMYHFGPTALRPV